MSKSFPLLESSAFRPTQPLYSQVAAHLREQVESGAIKPGERLPSFGEMKARYGLSQATMERAHAMLLQAGLIERRRGLGTFVAEPARDKATGVVGVMAAPGAHKHPYFLQMFKGMHEAAAHAGMELLVLHAKSQARWEKIEGILLLGFHEVPAQLPFGMPCVSLMTPVGHSCVVADDAGGAREAVQHLLDIGHRKIAFMTQGLSSLADEISKQRLQSYRQAMRKAGIKINARWLRAVVDNNWNPDSSYLDLGRAGMERWLREDWKSLGCSAILAQNDECAVGIVEALQEAGLRVPQDVSVVGFDGTEISTYFRPRLTTVEVPLEEIGARGFDCLWEQIQMPISAARTAARAASPSIQVLPTILRARESTAPPARG